MKYILALGKVQISESKRELLQDELEFYGKLRGYKYVKREEYPTMVVYVFEKVKKE